MVFLLDNYDSFTYMLKDYINQLGEDCVVYRNNEISLEEIKLLNFDSIVISPGPCTPQDAGICMELIAYYFDKKPILGVCLGHQALGQFFGATLTKAEKPMHGKVSTIQVNNDSLLFKELPAEFSVMRYHSLVLKNLGSPLKITAQTSQHEIMAIEHTHLPLAGVQFHPESVLSDNGLAILRNWFTNQRSKSL